MRHRPSTCSAFFSLETNNRSQRTEESELYMLGGRVTPGVALRLWKPSAVNAGESSRVPSAQGAAPRSPAGLPAGDLPLRVAPDPARGPSGGRAPPGQRGQSPGQEPPLALKPCYPRAQGRIPSGTGRGAVEAVSRRQLRAHGLALPGQRALCPLVPGAAALNKLGRMHLGPGQRHPLPQAGAVNKRQAGTMATWNPALGRGAGLLLPAPPQLTLHLLGLPYPGHPSRAVPSPPGHSLDHYLGSSTKECWAEQKASWLQRMGPRSWDVFPSPPKTLPTTNVSLTPTPGPSSTTG